MLEAVLILHVDALRIVASAACGDVDGAVDALVAIECQSGGVLEHGHLLHLVGRDVVDAAFHTVDQRQVRLARQRLESADVEGGIVVGIVSGALQCGQAQTLAEERVAHVLGRALHDAVSAHHRHRCYVLVEGLIVAIAVGHHRGAGGVGRLEHHVQLLLRVGHGHLGACKAYEGEVERLHVVGQADAEVARLAGDSPGDRPRYGDGDSGQRITLFVRYRTRNACLRLGHCGCKE